MFGIHEVFNTQQLEVLKSALSADIASNDRLLIGDNEGLYMLDINEEELYKFSEKDTKRVTQIQVLQKEGLILLLSGMHAAILLNGALCCTTHSEHCTAVVNVCHLLAHMLMASLKPLVCASFVPPSRKAQAIPSTPLHPST